MSGHITVNVQKAMITKEVLFFGIMDPYFVAKISDEKKYKSEVKKHEGKYPMFNETFNFIHEIGEDNIEIDLFHADKHVRLFYSYFNYRSEE